MLRPQQSDLRNLLDLSGYWNFQLDPASSGREAGWMHGLPQPRTVAVPASWNEQFQDTRDYLETAWYTRETYAPSTWHGQRIFVHVGSANYAAEVWINGQFLGEHQGGHLPFVFEVTEHVAWGKPNIIVIRVENRLLATRVPAGTPGEGSGSFMRNFPNTHFDFFPYAGLHRAVTLFTVPQAHIRDVTVVTDIQGDQGKVTVTVERSDGGSGSGQIVLSGETGEETAELTFAAGRAAATLNVDHARLWSPADPYLYSLTVLLTDGGQAVDRYALGVGIRTVEVRGDRLFLNGEPIFLTGFGKHEDFPVHGRGLNLPLTVKDNSLLKWIGANSYRTSHYPYSEEAMELADREGILIIDEIPAVSLMFNDGPENIQIRLDQCKQQIRELIARDKNHPSVIMWSVANEPFPTNFMRRFMGGGPEEEDDGDEAGTAFFRDLFELTRSLDPSRPATLVGVMGGPVAWLELADVACINRYWGWYSLGGQLDPAAALLAKELDELHAQLGKPILITEFGADTLPGMHADPPEMWSEEYQVEYLRRYLDVAAARPYVAGLHVWNFADFKTSQGSHRAGGLNFKGVFTRDRRPKMAAHFLRSRWAEPGVARRGT